jgi:hypothetical protein
MISPVSQAAAVQAALASQGPAAAQAASAPPAPVRMDTAAFSSEALELLRGAAPT